MLFALDEYGNKVTAMPKGMAFCPVCKDHVIAKCGARKARHWAHKYRKSCDPWFEETEWHNAWKSIVKEDHCEVVMQQCGEIHRADIVGNRNVVIELQHSSISPDEIRIREKYYGNMIWVLDAADFFGNIVFMLKGEYAAIVWYHPRTAFFRAKKPVYFHLPCGNLFRLEHLYTKINDSPMSGWGHFIGWEPFFYRYLSSVVKPEFLNGHQPDIIKNRTDVDISRLKFHHGLKVGSRCECDQKAGYVNCRQILKSAELDYIKRTLCLGNHIERV